METGSRRVTSHQRAAGAFTVIEMLVVLGIIALLMAVAIPLIQPAFKDRKLREASRQLNALFASAKARSAEHGRHVAIWFERDPNIPNRCLDVYMADVPAPYAGDVSGARALVRFNPTLANNLGDLLKWQLDFAFNATQNAANSTLVDTYSLIKVGESFLIRFENQGAYYACTRIEAGMANNPSDDMFVITIPPEPGPYPPPYPNYPAMFPYLERFPKGQPPEGGWHKTASAGDLEWGQPNVDDDGDNVMGNIREAGMGNGDTPIGLSYQIYRRPMKSARASLQMPNGTAIDLGFSGIAATGKQFDAYPVLGSASLTPTTQPVVVTVTPTGSVDRVYLGTDGSFLSVDGTVHLLVGHNDLTTGVNLPDAGFAIPPPALPPLLQSLATTNIGDTTCYWVSFGNRTGGVATENNADFNRPIPIVNLGDLLANSRQLVRSSQSKGGG
jgi:type II secretory pathway pseudopilin PulG